MTKYIILAASCILLITGGCLFSGAESPRPLAYQVEASKEITTQTVEKVMSGQLGKQEGIEAVGIQALTALSTAKTKAQVEGITNIVANVANEIRVADGSAKLLSTLTGGANKSMTEMSAMEYLGYVAGQTAMDTRNREKMAKGIDLGLDGVQKLAGLGMGIPGVGGLIALGVSTILKGRDRGRKKTLLGVTGSTIEKFAAENPEAGKVLKAMIAKATSSLPIDAKKEFNI